MKVIELLKEEAGEDKAVEKWLKENYTVAYDHGHPAPKPKTVSQSLMNPKDNHTGKVHSDPNGYYVYDGVLLVKKGYDSLSMSTRSKAKFDDCPVKGYSSKVEHVVLSGYMIDDFGKLPNVKDLRLDHYMFDSFKGIEKLNKLETLYMYYAGPGPDGKARKGMGVLRLLKCPRLRQVTLPWNNEVAKIINKHLKGDRDVLACQNEMLDSYDWMEPFAHL